MSARAPRPTLPAAVVPSLGHPGKIPGGNSAVSSALPSVPTVRRVSFCPVCRAAVRVPGVPCEGCRPGYVRQTREALLGPARATLPSLFAWARFDAPELGERVPATGAIGEARAALEAPRVVLCGFAGRGKTSLACAIAHAVLEAAVDPACSAEAWRRAHGLRFVSAYELARAASQHSLGEGAAPLVRDALGASLLIIDDLGAESRVHNSPIPDVIYDRHARGAEVQTVITTGLSDRAIAERYGDGIARRVFEGAQVVMT